MNSTPSALSGPILCTDGKHAAKGISRPDLATKVSALGVNWQNAPKRSIAWNPRMTAAFKSNYRFEGGRKKYAGKFKFGGMKAARLSGGQGVLGERHA